jgi:hypothetical protein
MLTDFASITEPSMPMLTPWAMSRRAVNPRGVEVPLGGWTLKGPPDPKSHPPSMTHPRHPLRHSLVRRNSCPSTRTIACEAVCGCIKICWDWCMAPVAWQMHRAVARLSIPRSSPLFSLCGTSPPAVKAVASEPGVP